MSVENFDGGSYVEDSVEDILDAMMADAREYFNEDINDSEESVIRTFYRPVAVQLSQIQGDIGIVLESAQIDNAQGAALDLLTALIGVRRKPAQRSEGTVRFSRETASTSTDYVIPSGTLIQTQGLDPVRVQTTESSVLEAGNTSVDVPVEAVQGGSQGNVTTNTLVVMPDPPTGIEDATNPSAMTGGEDIETDQQLRQRAKEELSEAARSTQPALLKAIGNLPGVESVSIFPNGNEYNLGDQPGFELVIEGGDDETIGQTLIETKAAGDHTYGGNFGTEVITNPQLENGQTQEERFSRPDRIEIYIDTTIDSTEEYEGNDFVKDSIVNYIGGTTTSSNTISGQISVGEDVVHGEIEYAIRNVDGVYDVTDLLVDVVTPPEGTTNISIDDFEVATVQSDNITITEL